MTKPSLVALLFFATHSIFSQESLSTSGGEATGSGGTSSYSVGQLVYTIHSGSTGTLTQGVQQSIELFTLTNPEFTGVTIKLAVYPNPTADFVILKQKGSNLKELTYTLYDIQGKRVANGHALEDATRISMQNLQMGVYILKVNQNSKELKSFKIIKN
jgi:hypothetical protein